MDPRVVQFWYSPGAILEFADLAVAYCTTSPVKSTSALEKVLGEGRAGAFMAMSLAKLSGVEVWVRLVDPARQAPDVEIMYLDQHGKHQAQDILGVEVATYRALETGALADFILRTKLNREHAYGEHTAIVIYVQKAISGKDAEETHRQILDAEVPSLVILLGQVDDDLFQTRVVYPSLSGPVDVRSSEALDSSQLMVAEARRGMSREQKASADPIVTPNPFMAYVDDA